MLDNLHECPQDRHDLLGYVGADEPLMDCQQYALWKGGKVNLADAKGKLVRVLAGRASARGEGFVLG